MLMVACGAAIAIINLMVGFVIGIHYGAKFTKRILEREGRLIPETPPTLAQSQKEWS